MTVQKKEQGLIHPFNLMDPNDRAEMFESKPPLGTTMVVYLVDDADFVDNELISDPHGEVLLHWEDCDVTDLAYALHPIVEACVKKSSLPGLLSESIGVDPVEEYFPSLDWVPLNEAQREWAIDKTLKLQIGFYDLDRINSSPDPISAVYAAMTVYDRIYSMTGIAEPKDQTPAAVDTTFERAFRVFVNDMYKERIGVWCRDLANLRNEVMVKIRAVLHGEDPEAEWKKFCDSGMVHFLDYLKIWQPPEQ